MACADREQRFGEPLDRAVNERTSDRVQATQLERWLIELEEAFADRSFQIEPAVAHACGRLSVDDPLSPVDGLLAPTAVVHGLTVVTCDTAPFERGGVPCHAPWT